MRRRVAASRHLVERRAAGIGKPQQTRRLVVGLAGGVVVRAAENAHACRRLDRHELGVSARDEQREKRIGWRLVAFEKRREDVAVQMVDRVKRLV